MNPSDESLDSMIQQTYLPVHLEIPGSQMPSW